MATTERQAVRLVLDLDPYDDPCHGQQQLQLFNGYYDCHCYLPLFLSGQVDGGRQYIIGALLRPGNAAATLGAPALIKRVAQAFRQRYPQAEIIVRGDTAYGAPEMIELCRQLELSFCFGKARNPRLQAHSEAVQIRAALHYSVTGRAEQHFAEFQYQAQSWRQPERTLCKAEVTQGELNPRFVVTNLREDPKADQSAAAEPQWTPRQVYQFYCQRGETENRIKEFKLDLEADRLSCHSFRANQFRLLLHVAAYALFQTLQDGLAGTELAAAQVSTIRVKLLKVAARVVERCRRVRVQLPSSYPWQELWRRLLVWLLTPAPHWAPGGG